MSMKYFSAVAYEESVSAVTLVPSVELGARREHLGEQYVYCFNAGGASANAGYGVKLITGASGYSVAQTSLTDVFNPCVGIVRHVDLPAAAYGWVMTRGFANVHSGNSTVTGDYVAIGLAVGGAFGNYIAGTGVVATNAVAGVALGANTASAGTFYAFINTGY
jgi:hypothetical protein